MEGATTTTTTADDRNDGNRDDATDASCTRSSMNNAVGDEDDDVEEEEMFVTSDPRLGLGIVREWGGPRRGGALAEPTRFGDWERKGRCTDF
jgi:hypothetical protein